MGGIGSGRRWHFGTKATTDSYRAIDVRRWAREGLLEPGRAFGWEWTCNGETTGSIKARAELGCIVLDYRTRSGGSDWQAQSYPVYLDTTPCHLGGARQWFLCPARGCGQRVARLHGGEIFACRHCHQLAYPSQHEDAGDRAARRAHRIRDRLGWPGGVLEGSGWEKPKGMHWRTYQRLCDEHDTFEHAVNLSFITRFGPMLKKGGFGS